MSDARSAVGVSCPSAGHGNVNDPSNTGFFVAPADATAPLVNAGGDCE